MTAIKIYIVDDHKMIRDGIRALLSENDEMEITGDSVDGADFLAKLPEIDADVVLMDIKMPNLNGIEATKKAKKKYPDLKILAMSMHDEDVYILNMLKSGASGYILKNVGKDELQDAIKVVNMGGNYYSKEVSSKVMQQLSDGGNSSSNDNLKADINVTDREAEILKLILNENTNQDIADKLNISARTVDTHRRNLLKKFQVKNTAGLVRYALKHGLAE